MSFLKSVCKKIIILCFGVICVFCFSISCDSTRMEDTIPSSKVSQEISSSRENSAITSNQQNPNSSSSNSSSYQESVNTSSNASSSSVSSSSSCQESVNSSSNTSSSSVSSSSSCQESVNSSSNTSSSSVSSSSSCQGSVNSSSNTSSSSSNSSSSIVKPQVAPVLSGYIQEYNLDLYYKDTIELVYNVEPVASEIEIDLKGQTGVEFKDGKLKFTSVGTYNFTLIATNDNLTDSFDFRVVVTKSVKPVLSNFTTEYELDLSKGNSLDVMYEVEPLNAQISIDLKGQNGVELVGKQLKFSKKGIYNFTLIATNDNLTDSFDFSVDVYNLINLQGEGTESSPFLLTSREELVLLSETVYNNEIDFNGYFFKQTQNIDLDSTKNWMPIGTIGLPFSGSYDGNNFKVYNLKIDTSESFQGFFGFVQGGKISNLTVEGEVKVNLLDMPYAHSFVGGIVGAINNGTQIENCVNKANVTGDSFVGGIVGEIMETDYMQTGVSLSKLKNCINYGTVLGIAKTAINEEAMYYGGIAGRNNGIILGCENRGQVSVDMADATKEVRYVGGIAGYTFRPFKSGTGPNDTLSYNSIENCNNYADISGQYGVGGIVGNQVYTLYNCINYGEISGDNCVGGIVGILGTSGTTGVNDNVIEGCVNEGKVIASVRNLGGIVGFSYGEVKNSTNKGIVGEEKSNTYYVGGIVGTQKVGNVTKCVNTSSVMAFNATSIVGGIVGDNKSGDVVECINQGVVSGNQIVGGIVGRVSSESSRSLTIKNCENKETATITAKTDIGGIVGRLENSNVSNIIYKIEGCKNYANVNGKGDATRIGFIGGILGMHGSYNVVEFCENYGNVTDSVDASVITSTTANGGIGGISAGIYTNSILKNSLNQGVINGAKYTGGIVGLVNGGSVIESNNLGNVNGLSEVGGVVGNLTNGGVSSCTNQATIVGEDRVGGIIGRIAKVTTATTIYKCINKTTAIVNGKISFGGIVGRIEGATTTNYTTIDDCYNQGTIAEILNTENSGYVGGIVGMHGSYNVVVNCVNDGAVSADGYYEGNIYYGVGGISGSTFTNSKVNECVNNGNITASLYAGGLVGATGKSGITTYEYIVNCENTGTITANSYAGGIVSVSFAEIKSCQNKGEVKVTESIVGGVVAENNAQVTNCTNSGTISANVNEAGGIVGVQISGVVKGCINTKEAIVKGIGNSSEKIGGIVGYLVSGVIGETESAENPSCINHGTVQGNTRIAGIVGYVKEGTIANCLNDEDISATKTVGGIVGYLEGGVISYCENTGSISATGDNVGGIVGYVLTSTTVTIDHCTNGTQQNNTTIISGANNVAGIASYIKQDAVATVSNCVNYATIQEAENTSNSKHIGGIVGMLGSSNQIISCDNYGDVTGDGVDKSGGVGGIVASIYSNNIVKDCNNYGTITGKTNVDGIAGYVKSNTSKTENCNNSGRIEIVE